MYEQLSYRPVMLRMAQGGKAGEYIGHFGSEIKKGDRVVIWARVSNEQNRGKLKQQVAAIRAACARVGAEVVDVIEQVVLGFQPDSDYAPQKVSWLEEIYVAAITAKRLRAKLVATETDRFVRNPYFQSNGKIFSNAQARKIDLDTLRDFTIGVPLLTLTPPDASTKISKSAKARRGQDSTGRRGGRPVKTIPGDKKRRKEEKLPEVLRLYADGYLLGEIVALTRVSRRTVSRWIARHGKEGGPFLARESAGE